ncbi:PREDICTED: arylphorin subunit alpha-like [Ceratosolen solmsi marchali]|uniref:Arylphorin subunit alpha-like n=1 Tax=Ceratosolen solmsi marchali TaxID=326594 RepID=A0AAJ7E3B1_9HYME|nr:PREDICTED: arylphorin subunit alpha-like [Ceratosolen solmsi marchali]
MREMLKKCLLFAVVAVSLSTVNASRYTYKSSNADGDLLINQKKIYDLFLYVSQPFTDTEYFAAGHNYDIFSHIAYYTNREVVEEFMCRYKAGFLHKDALFTYYNQEHRDELVSLYRLFYAAKDFSTFYKTAAWARIHMNPALFTTALISAISSRDDCKFISFPYISEICPNAFFDSKIIYNAQQIAMTHGASGFSDKKVDTDSTVETYHLYSNFSNSYPNWAYKSEHPLAYFTNDIKLNNYYYYFRMAFPFFISTNHYNTSKMFRGKIYFFIHQQLMARYFLERYSNGFTDVEYFNLDKFILPPFYDSFVFPNGVPMPRRDWWNVVPAHKLKYFEYLKKLEIRIMEAIDSGYFYDESGKQVSFDTPEGLNYLGNIIEGNYDSFNLKYYGSFDALARNVFGAHYDHRYKNYNVPSALQYFATSMKDPAFYRIYYKIVEFYYRHKSLLGHYPKHEVEFSGVKFENVDIGKLITFFENKHYFINNAVNVGSWKNGQSFVIKAHQYQLNYKPFSYKFTINSDKMTKAVIRIFLGPASYEEQYDDYSHFLHFNSKFFMVDEFEVHLKEGTNSIERYSNEAIQHNKSHYSFDQFYKKLNQAIEDKESFELPQHEISFPHNLYLPKGSPDGKKFKFFFYIGPCESTITYELPVFGKRVLYSNNLGFPLDRPVSPFFFQLGNIYVKDTFIYHKKDYEFSDYHDESHTNYFVNEHHTTTDFFKSQPHKNSEFTNENDEFSTKRSDRARSFNFMHI